MELTFELLLNLMAQYIWMCTWNLDSEVFSPYASPGYRKNPDRLHLPPDNISGKLGRCYRAIDILKVLPHLFRSRLKLYLTFWYAGSVLEGYLRDAEVLGCDRGVSKVFSSYIYL